MGSFRVKLCSQRSTNHPAGTCFGTHADAGQMHLYLNYVREHWMLPEENPPIGIVLCAKKNSEVVHYALEGLPNKVLAAQYQTALPDEETLKAELKRTRRGLELRHPDQ